MASLRFALVLVLGLALAGCATVTAPEPGFSDEEWAEIIRHEGDITWEYFGFPAALRPPDPPMEFVSRDEYSARYADCMNDAGFENYLADGSVLADEEEQAQTDAELIASYDCSLRIVLRPEDTGVPNQAQRDYLYDYFVEVLVPCLVDHDIALHEVPSRAEFHESYGWWNPYFALSDQEQLRYRTDAQLYATCFPVPPGVPDPGYFGHL